MDWQRRSVSRSLIRRRYARLQKTECESPVSHPGDEAPFLLFGEARVDAVRQCLTGAIQPAMIGIDVLLSGKARPMGTRPGRESTPPTKKTPTFLLELPLAVEAGQAARVRAHLEAGRQFYNAVLSPGQARLRQSQPDPARHRP